MKLIDQEVLTGERALFKAHDLNIENCIFENGESPLKESKNNRIYKAIFKWKYPMWYSNNLKLEHCTLSEDARSGIWYTNNIQVDDTMIAAPKQFRKSSKIKLTNVHFFNALETMWSCKDLTMENVSIKGDYFGVKCENVTANNISLDGNYAFDGCKNMTITNSKLISKDAFWNCENIKIKNSVIIGEFLGWNSKNIAFENCFIQSHQGLCYVENLVVKNSKFVDTTLAFEYSTVDVEIINKVDSIKNPISGKILAKGIGEIIFDDPEIDKSKTIITIK